MQTKLLNEYEAAALLGMSPTLLRWLTSYAAKMEDPRKLKAAKREGKRLYFERNELLDYDNWLKQPWPHLPGKRPGIPTGIREEIRVEANGECAICNTNANTCEAAHVEPVAKSKNNHPHNLIWLCANHHTKYDSGVFGPDKKNKEFVLHFKVALHRYKKTQWENQAELSKQIYNFMDICSNLKQQLENAGSSEQIEAVERVAKGTLDVLPKLAPLSKRDKAYPAYAKMAAELGSVPIEKKGARTTGRRLEVVDGFKEEFRLAAGLISCTLCHGAGLHHGYECPICEGSGAIDRDERDIDLTPYAFTKCPLCNGHGTRDGEDCPECGGDRKLERRFAERVDLGDYRLVECPLCDGNGTHDGQDCPECGGDGRMERRFAERVETGDYRLVNCPLCEGRGTRDGEECPVCGGDKRMERRFAERVDTRDYRVVDCPLCDGRGTRNGEDCPECSGNGKMERRLADQVDIRQYSLVDCPVCKGEGNHRGDDCPACGGDGKMERRYADNIDPSNYD